MNNLLLYFLKYLQNLIKILNILNIHIKLFTMNNVIKSLTLLVIKSIKFLNSLTIKINKHFIVLKYPYKLYTFGYIFNFITTTIFKPFNCINYSKIMFNILDIQIVSTVKKGGIIRKFNLKTICGNKLNWLGYTKYKNIYLTEALENSYLKIFDNITYINSNLLGDLLFNNIKFKLKNTQLFLKQSVNIGTFNKGSKLKFIIEFLGLQKVHANIIGTSNLEKIVHILKNLH